LVQVWEVRRAHCRPGLAFGLALAVRPAGSAEAHASITTTLDLYPGETDRYADRLNEAAGMSGAADDAAR
jgi:hypothetical protein